MKGRRGSDVLEGKVTCRRKVQPLVPEGSLDQTVGDSSWSGDIIAVDSICVHPSCQRQRPVTLEDTGSESLCRELRFEQSYHVDIERG